jgi:hypothetical protein
MATNWTDLAAEIGAAIQKTTETGQLNVQSVTDLDGLSTSFHSLEDMMKFLEMAESKAQAEEDAASIPVHRPVYIRKSSFRR